MLPYRATRLIAQILQIVTPPTICYIHCYGAFIFKIMWVITRAINQYDQDGDYLVCVFENKPTFQDLKKVLPNESDVTIEKLTRGGGRQNIENEWYFLSELKSGELYEHS